MKIRDRTVLVCNCQGTMPLDGRKVCGGADIATELCRGELARFQAALGQGPLLVGCTQEAPLFDEQAETLAPGADIRYVNIRERAGWSDEAAAAHPKIAALLAEAAVTTPPVPMIAMRSEGVALIYGRDERAIEAGRQLMDRLDITVLLTRPCDDVIPPRVTEFPVLRGTVRQARGHLGAFELVVDDYAAPRPSSRRTLEFGRPRDGAVSRCDVILDLTGGTPLFPAHHKRDGYLRPDPGSPAEVQRAIFRAADLVGEFEKPRYVHFTADLCAHSRNRITGCTRCLEVCPTGAIRPDGDHVAIDAQVCAGCGACAAVCPTGAAGYALPPAPTLLERLRTLLLTFTEAGGRGAVLLVHDRDHGDPLIDLLARWGDGLPARVLPFAVNAASQLGVEVFAAAIAYGAAAVRVLVPARSRDDDREVLARHLGLAETVLEGLGFGPGRLGLIETDDPEELGAELRAPAPEDGVAPRSFLPLGGGRTLARLVLRELHAAAPEPVEVLPLRPGAPFGAIAVNAEGCTLCLACTQVCPTGALSDAPDRPALSFTEEACVQCGLCRATCPERVITLVPRLHFGDAARRAALIKEEEPYHCIRCGQAFGTKASIERIVEKLAGRHWMFADRPELLDRVRMCGDCRVIAQAESGLDPYAGPPRPLTRTAEDYRR